MYLAALALILLAGYWYMQQDTVQDSAMQEDTGTYAYTCDNGSTFTMKPSEDMQSIELEGGSQAMFTGKITLTSTANTRFEGTYMGMDIVFTGAGEGVRLMVGNENAVCNPVPSTDSPPWNWGDPDEGAGSMQPDVRLVVGESIMGKWQSSDDAKFVREFKGFEEGEMIGTVVDLYDSEEVSSGTYEVFTKERPAPMTGIPLEENTVYIRIIASGTQADALLFKVGRLTPETLELISLDRGGVLTFTAVR